MCVSFADYRDPKLVTYLYALSSECCLVKGLDWYCLDYCPGNANSVERFPTGSCFTKIEEIFTCVAGGYTTLCKGYMHLYLPLLYE